VIAKLRWDLCTALRLKSFNSPGALTLRRAPFSQRTASLWLCFRLLIPPTARKHRADRQRGVKDDNDDWPKMFATEPRERFDSDCSVFFLTCYPAVIVAAVVSLLGHFAVGAAKSLITIRPWWSSGLEMTFVGAIEVVVS
jgi:hypothetical protein